MGLTKTLRKGGALEEALRLGTDTLLIVRRVYGDEHHNTLVAQSILASVHAEMKDHAAALPLVTEVLAVRRHTCRAPATRTR